MWIALAAVMVVCVATIVNWLKLPTFEKINDVKEWLCFAVMEAEKALQKGTGQAKLRMVYDMFITKFPELQKYVSFGKFSGWVDDALVWLNNQLKNNENIYKYVYGSEEEEKECIPY